MRVAYRIMIEVSRRLRYVSRTRAAQTSHFKKLQVVFCTRVLEWVTLEQVPSHSLLFNVPFLTPPAPALLVPASGNRILRRGEKKLRPSRVRLARNKWLLGSCMAENLSH